MNLKEMYENNVEFKEYVDKYMTKHNKSLSEALSDAMVKDYAAYLLTQ